MTPSHHGLGSVVLCTAGAHTVAVDMRHVAGTGRVGRDREHVVDLAAGLGLAPTDFERVLHLQTPAGRVSLGVEKRVAAVRHERAHPAQRLAGAETARHFEAMAQVNGQWYLVLDVRPFTGGSAHAAEETRPRRRRPPPRRRRPAAPGPASPAAPRSATSSCSRPRRRARRRTRSPTRSARRRWSRSRSSPTSRRCRWRRRTCAACATGAAARSSSSTCRPG